MKKGKFGPRAKWTRPLALSIGKKKPQHLRVELARHGLKAPYGKDALPKALDILERLGYSTARFRQTYMGESTDSPSKELVVAGAASREPITIDMSPAKPERRATPDRRMQLISRLALLIPGKGGEYARMQVRAILRSNNVPRPWNNSKETAALGVLQRAGIDVSKYQPAAGGAVSVAPQVPPEVQHVIAAALRAKGFLESYVKARGLLVKEGYQSFDIPYPDTLIFDALNELRPPRLRLTLPKKN